MLGAAGGQIAFNLGSAIGALFGGMMIAAGPGWRFVALPAALLSFLALSSLLIYPPSAASGLIKPAGGYSCHGSPRVSINRLAQAKKAADCSKSSRARVSSPCCSTAARWSTDNAGGVTEIAAAKSICASHPGVCPSLNCSPGVTAQRLYRRFIFGQLAAFARMHRGAIIQPLILLATVAASPRSARGRPPGV